MKIWDTPAFTPPTVTADDWAQVLRTLHPDDHVITTTQDRYQWLRRLCDEAFYTKLELVTDLDSFPFWSLLPERVDVTTLDGKKLTKSQRSKTPADWAASLTFGKVTKPQLKKILAGNPALIDNVTSLMLALEQTAPTESEVHTVDGVYIAVTKDSFVGFVTMLLEHQIHGGTVAWDCETEEAGEDDSSAPNPYTADLVGISVSVRPGEGWYLPVGHRDITTDELQPWNFSKAVVLALVHDIYVHANAPVVLHNCKYDFSVQANPNQGMPVDEVYEHWLPVSEDTMLLAALVNEPAAGLKPLAEHYFGVQIVDFKKLTGGKSFAYVDLEPATIYAGQDADWTLRLWPILSQRARDLGVWSVYQDIEKPIVEYFMRCERRGLLIDQDQFAAALRQTRESLEFHHQQFIAAVKHEGVNVPDDFNINASEQLARILYSSKPAGLGLPVLHRTKTGLPSTDDKAMTKLFNAGTWTLPLRILTSLTMAKANPPILRYKELNKLVTAYLEKLPGFIQQDGRVRANFHQFGAATGRTSMSDPNPQQWPPSVRKAVIPLPGGEIATIDYSQIELRVMAALSKEPAMLETFRNGGDIHQTTQDRVGLPNRTLAKNFNFGVGFGAQPPTLSVTGGIPIGLATKFYEEYWLAYPWLRSYYDTDWEQANADGFIRTWSGRIRFIDRGTSQQDLHSAQRQVMNTPVQGGALDIIKVAMRNLIPLLRQAELQDIHPILMVHDELDFERGPAATSEQWQEFLSAAAKIMTAANPFSDLVEALVEPKTGMSWGAAK